jgi:hypothetical protein
VSEQDEPSRVLTPETVTSGPFVSIPFVMFQQMHAEVRLLRDEILRLQEYLEEMSRKAV